MERLIKGMKVVQVSAWDMRSPEAPTEAAGLKTKLAAEPATAEAAYTLRKRWRPLSISTAGPRELSE